MQVTLVPSAAVATAPQAYSCYLIDGVLAIDAGCLVQGCSLEELRRIRHVLISHAHMDHIASLPILIDLVYDGTGNCVTIHGSATVLECLRRDVFNNRIYPDFVQFSTDRPPFLRLNEVHSGQSIELLGRRITPVAMNHAVPSFGYLVEDDQSAVAFSSDTGPTEEFWKVAGQCPALRAVFLECTFPADLAWLADVSGHLTPPQFAEEIRKLGRSARILAVHMHPRHRTRVIEELLALNVAGIEISEVGRTYTF